MLKVKNEVPSIRISEINEPRFFPVYFFHINQPFVSVEKDKCGKPLSFSYFFCTNKNEAIWAELQF